MQVGLLATCLLLLPTVVECCALSPLRHVSVIGLPWELRERAIKVSLGPLVEPLGCTLEDVILPLDKRARTTGQAILTLSGGTASAAELASALHGQQLGLRYLEASEADAATVSAARSQAAIALKRVASLSPQSFLGGRSSATLSSATAQPTDRREIIVALHETPEKVMLGRFELNNLAAGRVDLMARAVSSSLFISHGLRVQVRTSNPTRKMRPPSVAGVCHPPSERLL
jgi:hypothetical protein|tara:strand:+ start:335 stop:1024 length:690 start_codon:yes stop_codon:yes gene_type:complete